jgi:hypothetical protein
MLWFVIFFLLLKKLKNLHLIYIYDAHLAVIRSNCRVSNVTSNKIHQAAYTIILLVTSFVPGSVITGISITGLLLTDWSVAV